MSTDLGGRAPRRPFKLEGKSPMAKKHAQKRKCGATPAQSAQLEMHPELRGRLFSLEAATRTRRATGVVIRRGLLRIPVIVHVVYKTPEENISDAQIKSQIQVLNKDFRAKNSDVTKTPAVWRPLATDAMLEFKLQKVVRVKTTKSGFKSDDSMKFATQGGSNAIDTEKNLNIWVCNLTDYLGYAYFPGIGRSIDGVVVRHQAFGTMGSANSPYNKGRTATHEIGHYLNLHHIWGGDSPTCGDSDLVDDTPNQEQPNYDTPTFPHISCNNGPSGDMFMNYMDYVDDKAMFMFTVQQVLRMRTALSTSRPKLGTAQAKKRKPLNRKK